jgi:ankyrin repeat protein
MRRDGRRLFRKTLAGFVPGLVLNVNHRSVTYGGRTMLGVAARLGSLGCATELCERWGAEVNCADVDGWTPLMEAAFRGNEAMAALLLRHGATDETHEVGGCRLKRA